MKYITESLLAAARSLQGVPAVTVTAIDDRLRWVVHRQGEASAPQTSMVCDGSRIVRVRSNAAGEIHHATVSDPDDAGQWVNWIPLRSDALPDADVAVSHVAGGGFRIFYQAAGNEVRWLGSSDGTSWTYMGVCATGFTQAPRLAAADEYLVTMEAEIAVHHKPWGGGSWTRVSTWGTIGAPRDGVGACYNTDTETLRLLCCSGRRLYTVTYDTAANTWSECHYLRPGGSQVAPADARPHDPDVVEAEMYGENMFIATWIDAQEGSPDAWGQPVAMTSLDGVHFGSAVPLDAAATDQARVALALNASTRHVYAGHETTILRTKTYYPTDETMRSGPLPVARYRRASERHRPSRLHVEVIDAEDTACFRRLARLDLARGYVTSEGTESISLEPHYILSARRTVGRDGGRLIVGATDGFGLLRLWSPQGAITWTDRSARWLLAEICARVGVGYSDDGHSALARTFSTYTMPPHHDGLQEVGALLRLAGCVGVFDNNGDLNPIHWADYAPSAFEVADVGDAGELLEGAFGPGVHEVTSVYVASEAHAARDENVSAAMAQGLRLHRNVSDGRIPSQAAAEDVVALLLGMHGLAGREGRVLVPLRPELQVWDVVSLTVDPAVLPAGTERVIVRIEERYDAVAGEYVAELGLGGDMA
ncbi:MAG: hypothetical protein U9R48_09895 [Chloroflexota bacterium]|nr:hypothetical protein [Chloroflexota bacterium]